MKNLYIFLFITLCTLIIYGNSCFSETNFGKNEQQKLNFQRQNCRISFKNNKNAEDVISLAKKEFGNSNYEKAIRLYKQALKLNPSCSEDIYLHLGISYNALDKYKKAIEPLNKSIEINPNNSSSYYNRGRAYYELKKMDNAKEDFKKAIEINKPVYPYEIKEARNSLEHIEYLEMCE